MKPGDSARITSAPTIAAIGASTGTIISWDKHWSKLLIGGKRILLASKFVRAEENPRRTVLGI